MRSSDQNHLACGQIPIAFKGLFTHVEVLTDGIRRTYLFIIAINTSLNSLQEWFAWFQ
jgi:hypothetical protein